MNASLRVLFDSAYWLDEQVYVWQEKIVDRRDAVWISNKAHGKDNQYRLPRIAYSCNLYHPSCSKGNVEEIQVSCQMIVEYVYHCDALCLPELARVKKAWSWPKNGMVLQADARPADKPKIVGGHGVSTRIPMNWFDRSKVYIHSIHPPLSVIRNIRICISIIWARHRSLPHSIRRRKRTLLKSSVVGSHIGV